MRKSKIIVLSAALLTAVMLLGSCSALPFWNKALGMEDVVDEYKYGESYFVLTRCDEVYSLKDASLLDAEGDLALFTKVNNSSYGSAPAEYLVYNMSIDSVVFSITDSDNTTISIQLYSANDVDFFTVTIETRPKYSYVEAAVTVETELYNADGGKIADASNEVDVTLIMEDFAVFEDEIYRLEDGNITYAFNKDSFAKTLSGNAFASTDKYYYTNSYNSGISGGSDSSYINTINVYDKGLKFVSSYSVPSYAENTTALVLDNGKIFVQYMIELDSFAFIYDVLEDGEKYDIVTLLVDPETGKEDKINFDYVVRYSSQLDDEDRADVCLSEDIKNVALVCPIEDKRIDASYTHMKYGTITDKGAFKAIEVIDGKTSFPSDIIAPDGASGEKLWIVNTLEDQQLLVDAKGNVKADVTNVAIHNKRYIIADGKVYNFDLEVLYDFGEKDLETVAMFDYSILFVGEEGEVVLYCNDLATTVVDEDDDDITFGGTIEKKGFYIVDASGKNGTEYVIYNEEGDEITAFENATGISTQSVDDYVIVSVIVSEKVDSWTTNLTTEYYKLH